MRTFVCRQISKQLFNSLEKSWFHNVIKLIYIKTLTLRYKLNLFFLTKLLIILLLVSNYFPLQMFFPNSLILLLLLVCLFHNQISECLNNTFVINDMSVNNLDYWLPFPCIFTVKFIVITCQETNVNILYITHYWSLNLMASLIILTIFLHFSFIFT